MTSKQDAAESRTAVSAKPYPRWWPHGAADALRSYRSRNTVNGRTFDEILDAALESAYEAGRAEAATPAADDAPLTRCPVCDGHGRRIPMDPLPTIDPSVVCHACGGKGYLATQQRSEPAPSTQGYYLPMDCPICGRHRMEWDGKVLRCEKCTTSSEWDGFTKERYAAAGEPASYEPQSGSSTTGLDVERLQVEVKEPSFVLRFYDDPGSDSFNSNAYADAILARLSSPENAGGGEDG